MNMFSAVQILSERQESHKTELQKPASRTGRHLRGRQNPFFFSGERIEVSPKQVELALYIRQYRRNHELSQVEMAELCTIRGRNRNVKFACSEISAYENYRHAPTMPKFQVLMETMDIDPTFLK